MTEKRDEPAENISGGEQGGGAFTAFDADADGGPDTRAEAVVDELGAMYWQKAYGGQDGFECLVRTILSQNTSDKASQPAHDSLMSRYGPADELAENLADAPQDELAETISSAGLYNQKSEVIVRTAEWALDEYGSTEAFDRFVRDGGPGEVRETLLSLKGVGPKTADCVLLFAGGRGGVFPVDTHVHRIARRMGLAPPDADHEGVRAHLERDVPSEKCGFGRENIADSYNEEGKSDDDEFHNGGTYIVDGEEVTFADGGVPPEKCGFGHTSMIQFGREYCKARKPACLEGPEACPLYDLCDRVGINEIEGTVFDPAETVKNT